MGRKKKLLILLLSLVVLIDPEGFFSGLGISKSAQAKVGAMFLLSSGIAFLSSPFPEGTG